MAYRSRSRPRWPSMWRPRRESAFSRKPPKDSRALALMAYKDLRDGSCDGPSFVLPEGQKRPIQAIGGTLSWRFLAIMSIWRHCWNPFPDK
jgi:hypothetical protein